MLSSCQLPDSSIPHSSASQPNHRCPAAVSPPRILSAMPPYTDSMLAADCTIHPPSAPAETRKGDGATTASPDACYDMASSTTSSVPAAVAVSAAAVQPADSLTHAAETDAALGRQHEERYKLTETQHQLVLGKLLVQSLQEKIEMLQADRDVQAGQVRILKSEKTLLRGQRDAAQQQHTRLVQAMEEMHAQWQHEKEELVARAQQQQQEADDRDKAAEQTICTLREQLEQLGRKHDESASEVKDLRKKLSAVDSIQSKVEKLSSSTAVLSSELKSQWDAQHEANQCSQDKLSAVLSRVDSVLSRTATALTSSQSALHAADDAIEQAQQRAQAKREQQRAKRKAANKPRQQSADEDTTLHQQQQRTDGKEQEADEAATAEADEESSSSRRRAAPAARELRSQRRGAAERGRGAAVQGSAEEERRAETEKENLSTNLPAASPTVSARADGKSEKSAQSGRRADTEAQGAPPAAAAAELSVASSLPEAAKKRKLTLFNKAAFASQQQQEATGAELPGVPITSARPTMPGMSAARPSLSSSSLVSSSALSSARALPQSRNLFMSFLQGANAMTKPKLRL